MNRWQQSQLTILTRNDPQEAVLNGCKTLDGGDGATDSFSSCWEVTCDQFSELFDS